MKKRRKFQNPDSDHGTVVLAQEIADEVQTALDQFTAIAGELGE